MPFEAFEAVSDGTSGPRKKAGPRAYCHLHTAASNVQCAPMNVQVLVLHSRAATKNQTAKTSPFDFAGADELIDHNLGAVGKVAELSLPEHQRIGSSRGIAVFETEHCVLRQHRVDHSKRSRFGTEMLQRNVVALIPLLALLVVQHGMTMTERTAAAVFPVRRTA